MKTSAFILAASALREKADIYESHPEYDFLAGGFTVVEAIAAELRMTAAALESRAEYEERQNT